MVKEYFAASVVEEPEEEDEEIDIDDIDYSGDD